jgi:NTE family protein
MTADATQSSLLNHVDTRIGIALGSGSARGWAHIGVLRALSDIGIHPGFVAGSSIGALVGAAYASDQLDALENWTNSLTWKDILTFMDVSLLEGGFVQGKKLMAFASRHVGNRDIQSLRIPFAAVATDLYTGREVWLRKGDLLDSIRASIALPGLFSPIKLDGQWLVDGGLVDPVPISLCRAMGAEVVIAVNLNGDIVGKHIDKRKNHIEPKRDKEIAEDADVWTIMSNQITNRLNEQKEAFLSQLLGKSKDTPGFFNVMAGAINIMQDRITRSRMAGDPPEVILNPRLSSLGLMEFDQAATAIEEGYVCVEQMRPALEQMLSGL